MPVDLAPELVALAGAADPRSMIRISLGAGPPPEEEEAPEDTLPTDEAPPAEKSATKPDPMPPPRPPAPPAKTFSSRATMVRISSWTGWISVRNKMMRC